MSLNQTRFFDNLVDFVTRQNEQLKALSNTLEDKVSKDKLIKALELKANRKDVTIGFDKLKMYMDNIKNDDKVEYVTKKEIGEFINEHLLLDGNQKFNSSDHHHKLNMIAYEKLLERKLENKVSIDDVEIFLEKKVLDYAKRDELRGIKDYIDNLSERVDNSEIESKVKLSEITEKFDDLSYDSRLRIENMQKELTSANFIKKVDINFIDKESYQDFVSDVETLKKAQITDNFDIVFKKTRKLEDAIKKLDKDFDYSIGKFKTDNEKIINELKFDVVTYKSDVLSEFSKVHKNIGSNQPVQEESNFDIKIDKLQNQIRNADQNIKNTESTLTTKINEVYKIVEEFKNGNEMFKKINSHMQIEIADLKKTIGGKTLSVHEIERTLDDMRFENNQKLKEIELEVKSLKIQNKERGSTKKVNSAVDDFETYVLDRISKLDRTIKDIDLGMSDKKLINTVKILPEKAPIDYIDEIKHLKTIIDLKADSLTICKLLDEKADIEEVNKLLKDLHHEIDNIPSQIVQPKQHYDIKPKSESSMWIWKSGLLISDQRIPWEVEQHNNNTSNFILCKNRYEIIVMNEGLYEISFGFFGRKKPKVELVLNSEIIVNSTKIKLNENTDKFENKHSNGNVVGLTFYDFITLPYNSRIFLNFEGGKGYEGFIRFKKFK